MFLKLNLFMVVAVRLFHAAAFLNTPSPPDMQTLFVSCQIR